MKMHIRFSHKKGLSVVTVLLVLTIGISCTTETRLLNKIPVNTVKFKVVDHEDNPISGAVVESDGGKSTATNAEGIADLKFGSVGVHMVTVMADGYVPSTMTVTLPTDRGETLTARLGEQVTYSGSNFMQMSSARMYPMLFTWLFNSYGYNMELTDYQAGEWTKWRLSTSGSDDALFLRKAFLKELENGQQWWQIQLFNDGKEEATYTAEVLFDENRSSIRRYREKIEGNEPQEKPVTENWYSQPNELTKESIEGATEKTDVSVEVPKGTFTADLINFGVAPGINLKIWSVSGVPGGTVLYETVQEDEMLYRSELLDYGTDAKTLLNSY